MENRTFIIGKKVNSEYIEANFDSLIEGLYAARKEKVKKLQNKKAAYESITAGYLFQELCERKLGITAEQIKIIAREHGKPQLDGYGDFKFNISHTDGMVVLAYGKSECGIDVERIREHDLKVARRCFCESEYDYIVNGLYGAGKREDEYARFFHMWTMKEAYLKYMGSGISVPLNSFEIDGYNNCFVEKEEELHTKYVDSYVISVCGKNLGEVIWEI